MQPELLLTLDLTAASRRGLDAAYRVHEAKTPAVRRALIERAGGRLRAVLTNGSIGLSASEIAALPRLEIVCCLGAGYEGVDVAAARRRGIVVTHGRDTNAACVADHAMGLLLALLRGIPQADAELRRGGWKNPDTMPPSLTGKRLGILGLGAIGSRIATRAAAFEMMVAYHNRHRRDDLPWRYAASPAELARESDILMVSTPGGAATRHIVDAAVLKALGPTGFIINVGRGSAVDTRALIAALETRAIAGAALDVFEGEPELPDPLRTLENVVLTPHIAGRSPEAAAAAMALVLENLAAHFSGCPPLTPVPLEREG